MIYIDFEYTSSKENNIDVVCCALIHADGTKKEFWLHGGLMADIRAYMKLQEGKTLIAYQATAEVRALISCGIDPTKYKWICLFSEWKCLKNKNDEWQYGYVMTKDGIQESFPPRFKDRNNMLTENGMLACCLAMLGPEEFNKFDLGKDHKNDMRDLILSGGPFNEYEKNAIQAYCMQDIGPLKKVYVKMLKYYYENFGVDIRDTMLSRGEYVLSLGITEQNGIPLNVPMLRKLVDNYNNIDKNICEEMNKTFKLFEFLPRFNKYKFSNAAFSDFLHHLGLTRQWSRTNTGKFSTDEKTIQKFRHIREIEIYYQTKKARGTLRYINPKTKGNIWDHIGCDERLRPYFGQFGTQTGRNAPKAKSFIFAMSNWMRSLVRPEPGKVIVAIDYKSQEFAIGADIAGDENMKEAYLSGDPYLYFAKLAGAVPMDGKREDYQQERDLFKATTLGLQYGMGYEKLARKLSEDTGKKVSASQAKALINKHRKAFNVYWKHFDTVVRDYKNNKCLATKDNFVLFGDNPNDLSVKNFIVQATGASILRALIPKLIKLNVKVIAPLHDAVYFECDAGDDHLIELVKNAMQDAANEFCSVPIGLDVDIHAHDELWIEGKGKRDFERISKFL